MSDRLPETYWEEAGKISYASAMFSNNEVERYVNGRLWNIGVEIGQNLGLDEKSSIIDLGCGDGALSNLVLAEHFGAIEGFDLSSAAIERAQKNAPRENIKFEVLDVTKIDELLNKKYDGAYLWGILHHVKKGTPDILASLSKITKHVVVLEPNGNNIVRKLLEKTKAYKSAGEDSFRQKELENLFHENGFEIMISKRVNIFPNFTPKLMLKFLRPWEKYIEKFPVLRALCTVNMWGLTIK